MKLPTPHGDKLRALQNNDKLPEGDKEKVGEALQKYYVWINNMLEIDKDLSEKVSSLVQLLTNYKNYIDLKLIFDSESDFLYRQKGQLKLDNSVIEEFLPYLIFKVIPYIDKGLSLGPISCYSATYFTSTLARYENGGGLHIRTKDQDFAIARRLYLRTSHDESFKNDVLTKSTYLGYICTECKTNLDKTMFQEAAATAHDVKTAVPGSKYFLLCEWLDMVPISTAPTDIDEVLLLRKAKRVGSQVRKHYATREGRLRVRDEYEEHINRNPFSSDIFERFVSHIESLIDDKDPDEGNVLNGGYF